MTDDPFAEAAIQSLGGPGAAIVHSNGTAEAGLTISARRDEEFNIVIEVIRQGERPPPKALPAGTVGLADTTMIVRQYPGSEATLRGVIWRGRSTTLTQSRTAEAKDSYSVSGLEWMVRDDTAAAYVVEWLLNMPNGYIWPEPADAEAEIRFEHRLGTSDAGLVMRHTGRKIQGHRALHVQVGGVDAYLYDSLNDKKDGQRRGRLVYCGVPDQAQRDKIRNCLSFLLGQPLIYLGDTTYDAEWKTLAMRSVSAFTARGILFRLPTQAPYPVSTQSRNLIDGGKFAYAMNALYSAYDELEFGKLSWAYWHALCAPFQWAAVNFGGIIEQLLRTARAEADGPVTLIDPSVWAKAQATFEDWMEKTPIDQEARRILMGKITNANNAPPNVAMTRLLARLGLEIDTPERNAWRDRNRAAHGGRAGDAVATILGNKLLHILIHRLVAALSGAADQYVDFYSLEHPHRPLTQAVPPR